MLRRFALVLVLSALWTSSALAQSTPRSDDSVRAWREDLAFLQRELPKQHPDAFHDLSKDDFEASIASLSAQVPRLSDDAIIVGLARIVASFGPHDGHTHLNFANPAFRFHFLPLSIYDFSDGLFLRNSDVRYAAALGGRLVSVGDTPASLAWKRILEITPGDNEMTRRGSAVRVFAIPELLHGLGIIPSADGPVPFTFEMPDGSRTRIDVSPVTNFSDTKWADARGEGVAPLYLQHGSPDPFGIHDPEKRYFFEYLAGPKVLYVKYNAVVNSPDESVASFFRKVFAFADSHEVDKFVLDVRNNGGGNNFLNRPILLGLIKRDETINRRGHLFVITGRETFSAAQNLVTQLDKYTDAIFVGEPTGGSPNHYGDARPIILPNSRIPVGVSTLYWQDAGPMDRRPWVAPQLAVDISSSDYRANRDPVLDAVFRYTPRATIKEQLRTAVAAGGKVAASAALRQFRNDPVNRYAEVEADINRLGYELLQAKKTDQAIAIFEVNTETFPQSWNTFDSLGEALAAAGRKEEAIRAYEHALELNPGASSSKTALAKLR